MKFTLSKLLLTLALLLLGISTARSQTLNWGSPIHRDFSSHLSDSSGHPLDETFVFELGSFDNGFDPTASNTSQWAANWKVFDAASYLEGTFDPITGYVTATADMNPSGFSNSGQVTSPTFSFAGLQAYLWVKNSNSPVEGTEWALVRADAWTFPAADPGCCPTEHPIAWSVSDLTNETPVWGGQEGIEGDGVRSVFSPGSYIQTYTFVPEPSSTLLIGLGALLLTRRRRS